VKGLRASEGPLSPERANSQGPDSAVEWLKLLGCCRFSGFGLGGGGGCGLAGVGAGDLAAEALDAAGGIDQLLLAGEERVALRADFDDDVALVGGAVSK